MGNTLPFFRTIFFSVCLGGSAIVEAAAEPKKQSSISEMDSAHARKLYLDGDFDEAILFLESSIKKGAGLSHLDSVFVFKHLGVMYAAKYETRELGKMYMYKLLMIEPTARIMDMFASDMIYMIFKNIQDEMESTRLKPVNMDRNLKRETQSALDMPAVRARPTKAKQGSSSILAWVGASSILVAAGVVAYVMLREDEPQKPVKAEF